MAEPPLQAVPMSAMSSVAGGAMSPSMGAPPGMAPPGMAPPGMAPPGMAPPGMAMMGMPQVLPTKKAKFDENLSVPLDRGDEMAPRRTLYINNISCKIPTRQLRKDVVSMASEYGKVISCVCMKSFWRRGQIYISFSTQDEADLCYNGLHSRSYAGQRLRVNYAREDTHAVQKELGVFESRNKEEGPMRPYAVRLKDEQIRNERGPTEDTEALAGGQPETPSHDSTFQQAAQSRGGTSAYFFNRLAAAKQTTVTKKDDEED